MWKVNVAISAILLLQPMMSATSSACSIDTTEKSPQELRADARRVVAEATAIVDGEVIRPLVDGKHNALLRAHKILKGPKKNVFEIGERNACDVALTVLGQRMRVVLEGGPDLYYLPIEYFTNATYQDEVLGSDRTKDWPNRGGQFPPPSSK